MAWELRGTAGKRGLALLVVGLGVLLSGCMQQTIEPASDANLTPRDRKLLANPALRQGARSPSRISATSSISTAGKRRARSWSIRMRAISITCSIRARRSATA